MTRRLFIALALPEEIRAELGCSRDQLASRRDRVSWVRSEQMHLTLRFLGDVDECLLAGLDDLLRELALRHAAPRLTLGEPGIFGPAASPRVVWIGLKGEIGKLERLARDLEKRLRELGLPPMEQGFKAHVTLGRVKSCRGDLAVSHLQHAPLPLPMRLEKLDLIESRLRPAGAEYHVLARHILSMDASETC